MTAVPAEGIAPLHRYNCDCLPDDVRTGKMASNEAAATDFARYRERAVCLDADVAALEAAHATLLREREALQENLLAINRDKAIDDPAYCGGCGGRYRFDTSVPNVLWNRVVRIGGGSEYLCAACVLRAFATQGVSFTAELYGAEFSGLPIAVEINGAVSTAPRELNKENNRLRVALEAAEARLADVRQALERIKDGDDACGCDHYDGNCCVTANVYCPWCIASVALAALPPRSSGDHEDAMTP